PPPPGEMKLIERRIGLLFAVFLTLLVIGAAKAAWLGVVKAGTLKQAAATQQESDLVVPARRGAITDRGGTELAVSQPAMTIAATPYLVKDPTRVAARLSGLLDRPEDELLRQLARRDTGFAYLARDVPAARARKVQRLELEGLEFIPGFTRVYPREWMASQLLGTVGTDKQGLSGLEYSLDRFLRGRDGERRLVKDALGEAIEMRETTPTEAGSDLRLTLDANVQAKAEEVLAAVGEEWKPKGATAIVMDPRDGGLLALANWPRVNANEPGDAPDFARQNRAIGATYEPGSTFKAFTVAGALEEKKVTPDVQFNLAPTITVADREIGESHPRGYVTLSTREILEQSSNVGAITIGQRLGAEDFDRWVRRFGFGQPTGIDLPGEEQGIVLPLERYSGSSMGNLPLGQGIAVTPMQMATAYAAIANGGVLRPAHIVEQVGERVARKPKGRRVISAVTAGSLRRMLEGVLGPGGTASGAAIPGYVLAGKTGTAEKPDPITGGYSESKYVSSFVGFAPAKRPKLLVAVMVDEPQGEIYGGLVAGPAFRQITSFALNYLKIPPG
ncbi:MAG: peptidoglycan D,D-transpeptidase FtsI family protein, partial [Solirubrobacteraceae bacterium]